VAVLSPFIIYLASKRGIQKLIGESPHPKRSRFILGLSWGLGAFLMLILSLFILLVQLNKPEVDFKNFIVFLIVPILLPIAFGVMKIQNITKKTKTGLICVIKKLATSTILFIIFIPLFALTNILRIDINSTPDLFHSESFFRGFIGWSMIFCFYVGILLFVFAVIDFTLVIKDLSTRKPRTQKQSQVARSNR
jgi:multisubunit Na+/H+ antiporter MnhB subunit